jgi:hypothetical protein
MVRNQLNNIKNDKNFFLIPIFIISYNRLDVLKQSIEKFEGDGYHNLIIIDNASNDKKLLQYLHKIPYKVYFLKQNFGPRVLWECHLFDDIITSDYYVLTDPDILPIAECPPNYVEYFYHIILKYPTKRKVGFSLKIDDLPEEYPFKYDIIRFESFYWENKIIGEDILYEAPIDTTFALYRPGFIFNNNFFDGIRTGYPYIARHLGWYYKNFNIQKQDEEYFTQENHFSTSLNNLAIQDFRRSVIRQLSYKQDADFYLLLKEIVSINFIKRHVTYFSVIKGFCYLLIKKLLISLNIK